MTGLHYVDLALLAAAIIAVAIAGGMVGYLVGFNKGRRHRWRR